MFLNNSSVKKKAPDEQKIIPKIIKADSIKYKKNKACKERYFVLKESSALEQAGQGPTASLDFYESEKKFKNDSPKGSIILKDCFNISRKPGSKDDHIIYLYTKDECYTLYLENETQLNEWLQALLEATEDPIKANKYERVWQVTIPKGQNIERDNLTAGTYRLCLTTDKKLHLVKVASASATATSPNEGELMIHELPLSCIRRFSHNKKYFIIELGRGAPLGAGNLCMLTDDGATSHDMHEAILRIIDQPSVTNHHHAHDSETITRPRSASTSESGRPLSTVGSTTTTTITPSTTATSRRTSRESITMASSNPQSIPGNHTSAQSHSSTSPGLTYYTTVSIRERCDSLPSNIRSKSKPVVYHRDGFGSIKSMSNSSEGMKSYTGVNGRYSSSSPPSNNPISPSFCSTDSIGSSFSEEYDAHHLNGDCYVTTNHPTRESSSSGMPSQSPIREEENPQEGPENFVLIKFPSQSRKTSIGSNVSGPTTPITTQQLQQQLRSSLNLSLNPTNQASPGVTAAVTSSSSSAAVISSSPSSCSSSLPMMMMMMTTTASNLLPDDNTPTKDVNETNGDYVPMKPLELSEALKKSEKTTISNSTATTTTTTTPITATIADTPKAAAPASSSSSSLNFFSPSTCQEDGDSYVPMKPISQHFNANGRKNRISSTDSNQSTPTASTHLLSTTSTPMADKHAAVDAGAAADDSKDDENEDEYFDLTSALRKDCQEGSLAAAATSTPKTTSETGERATDPSGSSIKTRSSKEFHLDEVNCYIFQDEEEEDSTDYVKLVRAYSTGSRPPAVEGRPTCKSQRSQTVLNQRTNFSERSIQSYSSTAKCEADIRVRSFSMGSQNVGVKRSLNLRK